MTPASIVDFIIKQKWKLGTPIFEHLKFEQTKLVDFSLKRLEQMDTLRVIIGRKRELAYNYNFYNVQKGIRKRKCYLLIFKQWTKQ